MCRNIKTLFNFAPPATDDEIRAASLQFVRKLSGFAKPSRPNAQVFERAVDQVAHVAKHLIHELVATSAPRDRDIEAAKARERSAIRFGRPVPVVAAPAARAAKKRPAGRSRASRER